MIQLQTKKIQDINQYLLSEMMPNVLICASSFDARCLAVPCQLSNNAIGRVFVSHYLPEIDSAKDNLRQILSKYPAHQTMPLNIDDPIFSADSIKEHLSQISNLTLSHNILFDITCFTRESLLMILAFLQTCDLHQSRLVFVYSRAKEYHTPLSKGIKEVRSVLGFSGMLHPTRNNHLIILAGYEYNRAISIFRDFEPQLISIGIGSKSQPPIHYPNAKETFESLIKRIPNVNQFEFDIYDPIATSEAIAEVAKEHEKSNIIVAPMNTKISTVGAALFASQNPDAQLCYASAETYSLDSVEAGEDCTFFELPDILPTRSPK